MPACPREIPMSNVRKEGDEWVYYISGGARHAFATEEEARAYESVAEAMHNTAFSSATYDDALEKARKYGWLNSVTERHLKGNKDDAMRREAQE
jgi:hypothetical protein